MIQTTANKAVRTAHVYGDSLRRASSDPTASSQPRAGRLDSPVAINPTTLPTKHTALLAPTSLTTASAAAMFSPLMARTDPSATMGQFASDPALVQQLMQLQQSQLQSTLQPPAVGTAQGSNHAALLHLLLRQSGSLPTTSQGMSPGFLPSSLAGAALVPSPAPTPSMLQLLQALSGGVAPPTTTSAL